MPDLDDGVQACGFVSVLREMMVRFVTTQFPTRKPPTEDGENAPFTSVYRTLYICVSSTCKLCFLL